MINLRMKEKLDKGEALDVNIIGKEHPTDPKIWILPEVIDGMDYCDAKDECWIWSIGQNIETGQIEASRDCRYQYAKGYKCLWLR